MSEERICPRDGSPLESRAVGSSEAFVCSACHGLWISGYDLAALLRSPHESLKLPWPKRPDGFRTTVDNTARCLCPARSLMRTVERQGVYVDLCPECEALWCDGGELEEIIHRMGEKSEGDPVGLLVEGGLEVLLQALVSLVFPQ